MTDVRYPLIFCHLCVLDSGWEIKEITTTATNTTTLLEAQISQWLSDTK
jgi:hypothetical protein